MKTIFLITLLLLVSDDLYATQDKGQPLSSSSAASKTRSNVTVTNPIPQKTYTPNNETVNLETAYKREYAFLSAQKKALKRRINNYKSVAQREQRTLRKKINVLEQNSVSRSAKIDQLGTQLADAERIEAAVEERSNVLEITYSQAETTLKNYGIEIPVSIQDNDSAKVGYLFMHALSLLQNLGAIHTEPGKFFLANGKQTNGKIIRLGNIAAYGISAEGSGSLVPAGDGDFKIWKESIPNNAIALSKNEQPDILQLFLFESRTSAIEETQEKTVLSIINSGGVIGWIIVALGTFALFLVLIRTFLLYSNSANTQQLSDNVLRQIKDGNLNQAKKQCEGQPSAITRVINTTLRHLKDDRDHMESIVHEAILNESGPLDRFGSTILVIASVSPLLGLLGTVTGMISTFDVITEFGTGDPKLLSGGISIALVTTELGLVVAIPALLLGSLMSAWARNIKRDMEYTALRITNLFLGGPILEETSQYPMNDNTLVLGNETAN